MRHRGPVRTLGSLLVWVLFLGVLGWFGVQGYVHVMDLRAISARTDEVAADWSTDAAALARASTGAGDVRPAGISAVPFSQVGARPTTAYRVAGRTLTVATTQLSCVTSPLVARVVETPVMVQVLVHLQKPWLPQPQQVWTGLRASAPCVDTAVPTTVSATLMAALGQRIVVDTATGTSVASR